MGKYFVNLTRCLQIHLIQLDSIPRSAKLIRMRLTDCLRNEWQVFKFNAKQHWATLVKTCSLAILVYNEL